MTQMCGTNGAQSTSPDVLSHAIPMCGGTTIAPAGIPYLVGFSALFNGDQLK
jgi:hypothetical protein